MSDYDRHIVKPSPKREAPATKHDSGKPALSLVPPSALAGAARALEFGAQKYGRDNYKQGMQWTRVIDAALRHITAYAHGEDRDQESGLSHVDHALACLAMLSYYEQTRVGQDDRR